MTDEGIIANFADKWNACEPSHVETLASHAAQTVV